MLGSRADELAANLYWKASDSASRLACGCEAVTLSHGKTEARMAEKYDCQRFKTAEIAQSFPETADTLLLDTYLTDEASASARVFRVYRGTPPHYHAGCDEYLYVLAGSGTFWMGGASNGAEFAPGDLLFFKRGVIHALPELLEEPVVFLSFDTPRRDPNDTIFVNPEDGTLESYIREK